MFDVHLVDLVLSSLIVMGAACIQVITGFGFPLVATPFLLIIFPSYQTVLICMVLSMFSLSLQVRRYWKIARWDLIWRLLVIGFPGLLVGVTLAGRLNGTHLKAIVGVTILGYVIIQWIQIEKKKNRKGIAKEASAEISVTPNLANASVLEKKEKPKGFYMAGVISGLLTGVVGLPGPPVVAVLVRYVPKDIFRATTVHYFLIQYIIALLLSVVVFNRYNPSDVFDIVPILIIPTFIGFLLGHPLRKKVSDQNFIRLVYSLLMIVGITSIWQII